jgi:hypothetical protein
MQVSNFMFALPFALFMTVAAIIGVQFAAFQPKRDRTSKHLLGVLKMLGKEGSWRHVVGSITAFRIGWIAFSLWRILVGNVPCSL